MVMNLENPSDSSEKSTRRNAFKLALRAGDRQIGLWSSLCSNIVAEVISGAGFSWIVLDAEHAPNEIQGILAQLQAMNGGSAEPVVRPPISDPILYKRFLDIGVRTFLIPQIASAAEARDAVNATRYPPFGIRGISTSQRANRFSRDKNYFHEANGEICLIAQIENMPALAAVDEIASIEGIDALFVGPSDLAGALGHFGNNAHPEVRHAFDVVLNAALKAGKPAGILAPVESDAERYLRQGFSFVAVGSDLGLLVSGCGVLVSHFRDSR